MTVISAIPNVKSKVYGGAWSIHDPETLKSLLEVPSGDIDTSQFCSAYKEWINVGKDLVGWQDFKHLDFSNGTTETFDKFYQSHQHLRLRLLRGEYFYHQIQARLIFKDRFKWIDDEKLMSGDLVVMSCPFSDTGEIPLDFDTILSECDRLEIPVMLDLAYISISDIQRLDLAHPSIKVVTTSLSKVFPVEHHRIGLRLRRDFEDDTLVAYNQIQYVNRHSVNIGHHMISSFSNQWLVSKYKVQQEEICGKLGVMPSSCVIFGIDHNRHFNEYNRGGDTNRLCFSRIWDGRAS